MFNDSQASSPETINKPEAPNPARVAESNAWAAAMQDAPEMASAAEVASDDNLEQDQNQVEGINDAAALINYGLDAAARELGVETVVQRIKTFDVSGPGNPIEKLFGYLGIDTPKEFDDVRYEFKAAKPAVAEFRENNEIPMVKRSNAGAIKAIKDMKELISEVEGADPAYDELRNGAKGMQKGYFEYAVMGIEKPGLTDLFDVLKTYKPDNGEEAPENPEEQNKAEQNPDEEQNQVEDWQEEAA